MDILIIGRWHLCLDGDGQQFQYGGQPWQDLLVDRIFAECRLILSEARLRSQPPRSMMAPWTAYYL